MKKFCSSCSLWTASSFFWNLEGWMLGRFLCSYFDRTSLGTSARNTKKKDLFKGNAIYKSSFLLIPVTLNIHESHYGLQLLSRIANENPMKLWEYLSFKPFYTCEFVLKLNFKSLLIMFLSLWITWIQRSLTRIVRVRIKLDSIL